MKTPFTRKTYFYKHMPCILNKTHDLCEEEDHFINRYQEIILLSCAGIEITQSDLRSLNCEVKHV